MQSSSQDSPRAWTARGRIERRHAGSGGMNGGGRAARAYRQRQPYPLVSPADGLGLAGFSAQEKAAGRLDSPDLVAFWNRGRKRCNSR
jgi:hypothetical protein